MPIKKTVLIKSHGAPASVHRVDDVNVNLRNNSSSIGLASFYDEDAFKNGLAPLANVTVYVAGTPADGENLTAFAEAVLTVAKPDDAPVDAVVIGFAVDRYVFAGGEIIAVAKAE